MLLRVIYTCNAITIKIPIAFFFRNKKIYKIHKEQKTSKSQSNLDQTKLKVSHFLISNYYKAIVIKTVQYWHKKYREQ